MFIKFIVFFLFVSSAYSQDKANSISNNFVHYPELMHAEVPFYPPIPHTGHFGGTIKIQVEVENGLIVNTEIKQASIEPEFENQRERMKSNESVLMQHLIKPTMENLKTWRFQSGESASFLVTYIYRIEGDKTPLPENPKVEMDLPYLINVTVRPFEPVRSPPRTNK